MSPGLHYDTDAIEYLARHLDETDAGASSHWREMHESFSYRDGLLHGLRGFGMHTAATPIAGAAHRLFQQPWRRFGRVFPGFPRIERIAREVARRQSRTFDIDMLRQALSYAYLESRVPHALGANRTMVVLDGGRIVARGSWEDLLADPQNVFSQMCREQQLVYDTGATPGAARVT